MIGRDVSGGRSTGRRMVRIDLLMFHNVRLAEALCGSRLCVRELLLLFFFNISAEAARKGSVSSCSVTVEIHRHLFAKKKLPQSRIYHHVVFTCLNFVLWFTELMKYSLIFCPTAQLLLTNPADAHDKFIYFYFSLNVCLFFLLTHFVFVFIWLYSTDFRAQICQSWLQSKLGSLLEINSVPTINAG